MLPLHVHRGCTGEKMPHDPRGLHTLQKGAVGEGMYQSRKKPRILVHLFFVMLFLVVVTVSGLLFRNSLQIHRFIESHTSSYLMDVNYQIVDKVNGRIEQSVQTLRMLRDSAILFEPPQVESFLERKKSFAGYDDLRLFASPEQANTWLKQAYPGVSMDEEMALRGETQLLFVEEQDAMIYCVSDSSDADLSVIIGVKTQQTLKELLNNECFNGAGTSFAITRDGQTITTPGRMDLYRELRELQTGQTGKENLDSLRQMEADIETGKAGTLVFQTAQKREIMLRYEPLDYSGWYVVTIIPADIISLGTEVLSNYNLILTAIVIALLFVSMVVMAVYYQKSRKQLSRLAFHDELTGGMNDTSFRMTAQQILKEKHEQYVLVSMDIQDFKMINQVYGTQEGNRTLQYVYRTLRAQLRGDEPMARNCGDVFFFLLKNRDEAAICTRLQRIYEEINRFNQKRKEPYYLELYFGIYQPQNGEESLADMQEKANIARKHKKGDDRYRYNFYDEEVQKKNVQEKELMSMVDHSLRNGDFLVYLQPKVQLGDNRIAGAEALIRWKHPELGMLSPAMFIPAAERYRLINRLDLFVFEEVCRTLARWKAEGRELLPISVNLSRQNMDNPNFLDAYRRLCRRYDVSPGLIEFELTETILFEDPQGIKCYIDEMHASGFQCSLDDFGTGFSALGLLNDLDVDAIKLDQSFFRGKNDTRRGRYIVEGILRLAAQLHIRTVAEGIDELRQVEYLRQAACDMIQGFYFFKPMPVEKFEAVTYEGGRLRTIEMPHVQRGSARMQEGSSEVRSSPEDHMIVFSYFPDEDEAVFSVPFSPVFKNETTIHRAAALFRSSDLIHKNDRIDFFRTVERCRRERVWVESTLRFYMSDGRYEWLEMHLHLHKPAHAATGGEVITGILVNMSGWKSELNRWKEKANRDALTGLYNREFFEQYVRLQLHREELHTAALIFIDVDDFKQVNDTLGHAFGDDILCCMAKRILGVFRHTDIAARYGGDEFVVFVPSVEQEILLIRLQQLCEVFQQPYRNGAMVYQISGSIGAAIFPDDGEDYKTLLAHADEALYEAKNQGKGRYALYQHALLAQKNQDR